MEFQKRIGGPHLHRVFCVDTEATPENIDGLIWAHIPEKPADSDKSAWANFIRKVLELLPKFQIHDCGEHCKGSNGRCLKGFPKPYSRTTILHANKPAEYKRPSPEDGGHTLTLEYGSTETTYTNLRIVPYNPYILVMFECHHNLEYAYGQSDNLKYALKYPFKGPSFSYIKCQDGTVSIDEPAQYARMLYRSPPEAHCRIYSQRYAYLSHTVIPLSIHLPGEQNIYFKDAEKLNNAANGILPETHLTQYWKMWKNNEIDKNSFYENMPENILGMTKIESGSQEYFLTVRKYRKPHNNYWQNLYCFSSRARKVIQTILKNINGTFCDTFADAARMRGLFEDNSVWEKTLREASNSLLPSQMRSLFVNILIHGSTQNCVIDSLSLWEMFKEHMIDKRNCTDAVKLRRIDRALAIIERYLLSNGKQMKDYRLPLPSNS
uniref:Helitron helicase-like domain-containing protein n=1 Tax=Meloidogyne incognita TaxID=6306 RepID=A0A914N7J7_MELIC